jgi:hypothetical protein
MKLLELPLLIAVIFNGLTFLTEGADSVKNRKDVAWIPKSIPKDEIWYLIECRPERTAEERSIVYTLWVKLGIDSRPVHGKIVVTTGMNGVFTKKGERALNRKEVTSLLNTIGMNEVFSLPERPDLPPAEISLTLGGMTIFLVRAVEAGNKIVVRRFGESQPVKNVVGAFFTIAEEFLSSEHGK